MTDQAVAVIAGRHLAASLPSMSETLRKWIEERVSFPAGTLRRPQSDAVSTEKQITELSAEYARYEQAGIAFNVLQGFVLAQAAAMGEGSLRRVVEDNDISLASASRNRDLYDLFDQLGDLKLVVKAEALGLARIRELKPYFGIDGIRQLIEGRALDGMQYALAQKLTSREITLWVRERKAEALAKRIAQDSRDKPLPESATGVEPRALIVARDDLIGNLLRARAEIELAMQELELLSGDLPEPARSDLLHFVATECKAVGGLTLHLHTACVRATDRNVNAPLGELESLSGKLLDERSTFAAHAAAFELAQRASARQQRFGWKGRPPASLESVMTHARKADGQEG